LTHYSYVVVVFGMVVVRLSVHPSVVVAVVCHGCIVTKGCEIRPSLLLITNTKSDIGF